MKKRYAFYSWSLASVLLVVLFCTISVARASDSKDDNESPIDLTTYNFMMESRVRGIYGLEAYFSSQQELFLPINPPYPDFTLHQSGFPTTIASSTFTTLSNSTSMPFSVFYSVNELGVERIGDAFVNGKKYLIEKYSPAGSHAFQLLGDPALKMMGSE